MSRSLSPVTQVSHTPSRDIQLDLIPYRDIHMSHILSQDTQVSLTPSRDIQVGLIPYQDIQLDLQVIQMSRFLAGDTLISLILLQDIQVNHIQLLDTPGLKNRDTLLVDFQFNPLLLQPFL
jgi:hypothetical protein